MRKVPNFENFQKSKSEYPSRKPHCEKVDVTSFESKMDANFTTSKDTKFHLKQTLSIQPALNRTS